MPKKTTTPKIKKATTTKKKTAAPKKGAVKKTVAKKKVSTKAAPAKKTSKPTNKTTTKKVAVTKKEVKAAAPTKKKTSSAKPKPAPAAKKTIVSKTKTPLKAKPPAAKAGFSLDDVRKITKENTKKTKPVPKKAAAPVKPVVEKPAIVEEPVMEAQSYGAASLADILGFNPNEEKKPINEEEKVSKKLLPYYKLLIELRDHVNEGLNTHVEDTLKRSAKEDTGDLSSYSQHMADAGTDTFDRDFALSLVSNEQEALHEIEEAIQRILNGTYGICEITGKAIRKERLRAVPFARFSVESQIEMEKSMPKTAQRGGIFADASAEDGVRIVENPDDE